MLKHRLLTAGILIPLILVVIWFFPVAWFAGFVALVMTVAAWEWAGLLGLTSMRGRCLYSALVVGGLLAAFYLPVNQVLLAAVLLWIWITVAVIASAKGRSACGFQCRWVKGAVGIVLLPACWVALNLLRASLVGPFWLLFALMLVWAVDTGAYATGRLCGKHLLAPRLSPKKTWEGVGGGVILSLLVAVVVMFLFRVGFYQASHVVMLTLLTALLTVVGDLFESLLKRQADVKDSGHILPGHGGLLDRIDGLLAAIPLFTLGSLLLGY